MKTNRNRTIAALIFTFAVVIFSSCQDTAMEEIEREIERNPNREINGGNNSGNENNNTGNSNDNGNNSGSENNDTDGNGNDSNNDGNTGNDGNTDNGDNNGGSDNDKDSEEDKTKDTCGERIDSNELPQHTLTYITSTYSAKAPYYYITKVTVCRVNGKIKSYTVLLDGPHTITLNFDEDGYPVN